MFKLKICDCFHHPKEKIFIGFQIYVTCSLTWEAFQVYVWRQFSDTGRKNKIDIVKEWKLP